MDFVSAMTMLKLIALEIFTAGVFGYWMWKLPKSWATRLALSGCVGVVMYVAHVVAVIIYWRWPVTSEAAAIQQAANDGASIIANIMFVGPVSGFCCGIACLSMLWVGIRQRENKVKDATDKLTRKCSKRSQNPYEPP